MRTAFLLVLVVAASAGCTGGGGGATTTTPPTTTSAAPPAQYTVDIQSQATGYSPSPLTIHSGDRVRWHNADTVVHTATADTGTLPNTGDIQPGGMSMYVTFADPGTYTYHCARHAAMARGTIAVQ